MVLDKDNVALYFSRSPIPYPRDESVDVKYYKHKGVYAFRKQALMDFYHFPMLTLEAAEKLEQLTILNEGFDIHVAPACGPTGIGVDTKYDLDQVIKELKNE